MLDGKKTQSSPEKSDDSPLTLQTVLTGVQALPDSNGVSSVEFSSYFRDSVRFGEYTLVLGSRNLFKGALLTVIDATGRAVEVDNKFRQIGEPVTRANMFKGATTWATASQVKVTVNDVKNPLVRRSGFCEPGDFTYGDSVASRGVDAGEPSSISVSSDGRYITIFSDAHRPLALIGTKTAGGGTTSA